MTNRNIFGGFLALIFVLGFIVLLVSGISASADPGPNPKAMTIFWQSLFIVAFSFWGIVVIDKADGEIRKLENRYLYREGEAKELGISEDWSVFSPNGGKTWLVWAPASEDHLDHADAVYPLDFTKRLEARDEINRLKEEGNLDPEIPDHQKLLQIVGVSI